MNELVTTDYVPSDDEPFMNERQKSYFRAKLVTWKHDILREARETLEILQQENANHPDLADRASSETDRAIELRARDRQRKLISKIDSALQRIEEWWIEQGQHRDYYYVEDEEGCRYWLFRLGHYDDENYQWFVHGYFV